MLCVEIERLLARGDYVRREIEALYYLRKYRALKQRYEEDSPQKWAALSQIALDAQTQPPAPFNAGANTRDSLANSTPSSASNDNSRPITGDLPR